MHAPALALMLMLWWHDKRLHRYTAGKCGDVYLTSPNCNVVPGLQRPKIDDDDDPGRGPDEEPDEERQTPSNKVGAALFGVV